MRLTMTQVDNIQSASLRTEVAVSRLPEIPPDAVLTCHRLIS
jgi:hypothetical protein